MDKEKYDEVVIISERIKKLNRVKEAISESNSYLTFVHKYSDGSKMMFLDWDIQPIKGLLETYAERIKQDIDNELSELEQKIKEI